MSLWAIVPVKPFNMGKSRLASVLSAEERWQLNSNFLVHTLLTVRKIAQIKQVLVVSRDQKALAIARDHGARTLQEDGAEHLNTALKGASLFAKNDGADGVLILPSDLPLLTSEDVRQIIDTVDSPPAVVIAPDRHGEGTNALLVAPPDLLEYQFGANSFKLHCEMAERAGARIKIVKFASLELDVDLPEDLEYVADKIFAL